ncbi:diaminopropionate ammonia-lyase [Miniphocaeibacter massiliensis]|uniref:diaminopropionate ammonia-lyase n=1 Tax=Miniphocaeibacter massiliensis TaxID=2041841 RepID=UPI000C1C542A|nr:diaminopropionate ammonia-lyase [Miniphocaeibacter massiliensis]
MQNTYQIATLANKEDKTSLSFLSERVAKQTVKFHSSFKEYEPTPLHRLKGLAEYLGVKDIFLKDESFRFGLNAFKVLGGSYAVVKYIADKLGKTVDELPYEVLISEETRKEIGELTFVTATDGNHGRGIAWTANKLKQKAVVFMPKGSTQERAENIRAENATCEILEGNYDDCVRYANQMAEEKGWIMVQDTAWEGYEDIPTWIMQGYLTMAYEAYLQLTLAATKPTHVFLQAGVGSMASAVTGFFASIYEDERPIVTIVEPNKADCLFRSAKSGGITFVTGSMETIMAGLACGEPCTIGWDVIRSYTKHFLSVPDSAAAHGMRILGNPIKGDPDIISGESGAVTMGVVSQLMYRDDLKEIKEEIGLNEDSIILCISTEGNTDALRYRELVWNGLYPNDENLKK